MELSPTTFVLGLSALAALMLVGLVLQRKKAQQDGASELLEWDDAGALLAQAGYTQLDVDTWTIQTELAPEPIGVKLRREHNQIYAWVDAKCPEGPLERFLGQSTRITVGDTATDPLGQWVVGNLVERMAGLPAFSVVSLKAPERTGEAFEIRVGAPFSRPEVAMAAAGVVHELLRMCVRR